MRYYPFKPLPQTWTFGQVQPCPCSRLALYPTTPARLTAHDSVETCLETYETTGHRILDAHSSLYPSAATRAILPSMDSIPLYLIDAARGPASTNRTVPERACRVSAKDLQDTKQHEHANTDACHVNGAILKRELLCFPPGERLNFQVIPPREKTKYLGRTFFSDLPRGRLPQGRRGQNNRPQHTRAHTLDMDKNYAQAIRKKRPSGISRRAVRTKYHPKDMQTPSHTRRVEKKTRISPWKNRITD